MSPAWCGSQFERDWSPLKSRGGRSLRSESLFGSIFGTRQSADRRVLQKFLRTELTVPQPGTGCRHQRAARYPTSTGLNQLHLVCGGGASSPAFTESHQGFFNQARSIVSKVFPNGTKAISEDVFTRNDAQENTSLEAHHSVPA
jgi:hypothetical protein